MYAEINMEGRVVNDPEFKTGKNGEYCTFRMVVNQKLGPQENASFYNCTGNEMIANRIKKAGVKKGRLIHINGEQTLRPYTDREGVERMSADTAMVKDFVIPIIQLPKKAVDPMEVFYCDGSAEG